MSKGIKHEYDLRLLELEKCEKAGEKFNEDKRFEVYFHDEYKADLLNLMSFADQNAYEKGAGGELKIRIAKDGTKIPPSMLSVASSARFCFLSLRELDSEVFEAKKGTKPIEFEKKLPILCKGTPPHIDAFYDAEDCELYFECKCHEMFDKHNIELSVRYFDSKDLLCAQIDSSFYKTKERTYKTKENDYRRSLVNVVNPSYFGLNTSLAFDVKQLLTHLMGINKNKNKKARLIYYYFIPAVVEEDELFFPYIKRLYNETERVFKSNLIQEFIEKNDITIELYVQKSDIVEKATKENTVRKYFSSR